MNFPRNIWNWIRRQFVDEVPEAVALCEFDCRKPHCNEGDWEVCQRRLQNGAEEFMPVKEPASVSVADSTTADESDPGLEPPKP
jgi:hypothetical protein